MLYTRQVILARSLFGAVPHSGVSCWHAAVASEVLEALPEVYQYLLEQVVHLLLVIREEIADGIYRLAILSDHLSKSSFNVVHQLSFCRSTLLDTQSVDSFQQIESFFKFIYSIRCKYKRKVVIREENLVVLRHFQEKQ